MGSRLSVLHGRLLISPLQGSGLESQTGAGELEKWLIRSSASCASTETRVGPQNPWREPEAGQVCTVGGRQTPSRLAGSTSWIHTL